MDAQTAVTPDQATPLHGVTFSTADIPPRDRREWLQDVIRREYTKVEVTPPEDGDLFNEMTFYAWEQLRLSVIRSKALTINRLAHEPYRTSQDSYLGVVLLSGEYLLEQDNREVFLNPGDMAIYDATRPHRIHSSREFSKLIVTIPRTLMRARLAGVEHCTALRIPGDAGMGAVAANFIRSAASQASSLSQDECSALAEHSLDLLTLALVGVRPQSFNLSRSRSLSLSRVKDFVERHLVDPAMDTTLIAAGVGLSARYINDLFKDEQTSLMRYVWRRRLDCCRRDMLDMAHRGHRISEIAFRWGFNDLSHFSRAFRQYAGCSPRDFMMQGFAASSIATDTVIGDYQATCQQGK
jgi:AraC-like DNA-binding protein/mannose-6-phosphate isomerase-like protein (cupin superfamily)